MLTPLLLGAGLSMLLQIRVREARQAALRHGACSPVGSWQIVSIRSEPDWWHVTFPS